MRSNIKSGVLTTLTQKPMLVKVPKNTVGNEFMSDRCSCCFGEIRSLKREFSVQAWAALVSWQEISTSVVDQAICDDCYFNLRDTLIERADEFKAKSSSSLTPASIQSPMARQTQMTHRINQKKLTASNTVKLRVMV